MNTERSLHLMDFSSSVAEQHTTHVWRTVSTCIDTRMAWEKPKSWRRTRVTLTSWKSGALAPRQPTFDMGFSPSAGRRAHATIW